MSSYKLCVNLEMTSKCNARCSMCPRALLPRQQSMDAETFATTLTRLLPGDVHRTVIAGYGEPSTHPQFFRYMDMLSGHPVRFDMVSNGHLLEEDRLHAIDGRIHTLIVSFSSIVPEVYETVHAGLDQARVMRNICRARDSLQSTNLVISLTPTSTCIDHLPQTIEWLHSQGISGLSMSPNLYDRAAADECPGYKHMEQRLKRMIKRYRLRSQEFDFIPSVEDIYAQLRSNEFKCVPRNVDIMIAASGHYMYCFNDIRHSHKIGHVSGMSLREAVTIRERLPQREICATCNLRDRYGGEEVQAVLADWQRGSPLGKATDFVG